MSGNFINIACGDTYVIEKGWQNFDFSPHSSFVTQANLLGDLPLNNCNVDIVYSSHFIEHIPRSMVPTFLSECYRILKPRGRIRLVLPDLGELCSTYLDERNSGSHDKADFLVLEMLDQCVRNISGGELGAYYSQLRSDAENNSEMISYVKKRTGHDFRFNNAPFEISYKKWLSIFDKILSKISQWYCHIVIAFLPMAFRTQNISLTSVGERHTWIYDYHTLEKMLNEAGFSSVQKFSANTSGVTNFPFYPLDINSDGSARKGLESMYIEALRK